MTIDIEIFQTVLKMPESLKKEILHYAKYLLEKHTKTESSQEQLEQLHGYGSWVGQIVMSDDFDQPLEDLDELQYINIQLLPITFEDIEFYAGLPIHHRDPFDRILVAQAMNHSLVLSGRILIRDS